MLKILIVFSAKLNLPLESIPYLRLERGEHAINKGIRLWLQ